MLGLAFASAIFVIACLLLYITKKPTPKNISGLQLTEAINGNEYHRKNVLKDHHIPVITTLYEAFKKGIARNPHAPFMGYRQQNLPGSPYEWYSYEQVCCFNFDYNY